MTGFMEYQNWENHMLKQGYPKPFLKNIAVGSVVTLQGSIVKLTKEQIKDNMVAEAAELKNNSKKFGLAEMETLSDTLAEKIAQDDEFKDILKELVIHLKDYKEMVKENCLG